MLKNIQWNKIWEAIKLPLRLIVLGIIPLVIVELAKVPSVYGQMAWTALIIIDKYLHEVWADSRATANEGLYQVKNGNPVGLAPF